MEEKKIFLSTNIKYLRKQKNITQKQIADFCGKTDGAVSFWETGSREPNAIDLSNLSVLFNVSVSDLLLKDLRFDNSSEFDNYYNANKHLLTQEDKDMIRFLIEKRKANETKNKNN